MSIARSLNRFGSFLNPLSLGLAAALLGSHALAAELRLLSTVDPAQVPAGAGSDSCTPIITPDGRFLVFASSANNLFLASNNLPALASPPGVLNVFLRDTLAGTNSLVSVNLSGLQGGNADSLPTGLSADGRFVLFESDASDLAANDTNKTTDVFVRDLLSKTTTLVSATPAGFPGNGVSRSPAITPDGRFVVFVSAATNLVANDTNNIADVFLRDLQLQSTTLVSPGLQTALFPSAEAPAISADGRFVAFYFSYTNVPVGGPALGEMLLCDLSSNLTLHPAAFAASILHTNNFASFNYRFSADSRFLVYEAAVPLSFNGIILRYSLESGLSDLVATNANVQRGLYDEIHNLDLSADARFIAFVANTNSIDGATTCVRLWDAQAGSSTLVSGNLSNSVSPGSIAEWPALDASGRFVAFLSSATNMVTNSLSGLFHLYLRDTQDASIRLLDANSDGAGFGVSAATIPQLSDSADLVAFEADDSPLLPTDRNHAWDIFLRHTGSGAIDLASAHHPALPTVTPNGPATLTPSSISADGRFVVFASEADNLVPNDTNAFRDIFLRDLASNSISLVSVATNGAPANGISSEPSISADGRYVAFTSAAFNLVPGDTNKVTDIFIHDLLTATTRRVPVPGVTASYQPTISSDGRFTLFYTGTSNARLYDQVLSRFLSLTSVAGPASMTPDGRFVAVLWGTQSNFIVWDSAAGIPIQTISMPLPILALALSPDGGRVACWLSAPNNLQLLLVQRSSGVTNLVATSARFNSPALQFSLNNQLLAFTAVMPPVSPGNTNKQVYAYDCVSGASFIVSANYLGNMPGNGSSDSPVVSPDARFIAYRSSADNLALPGLPDLNGLPDIFLFDRLTLTNTLLSSSILGHHFGADRSLLPIFSADGSTLLFESWASDLSAQDFNNSSDLFAYTFLTAFLVSSPGSGPWLSWPWLSGNNYRVKYLDALSTAGWQTLSGSFTNNGLKAWMQDPSPAPNQRFYRVVNF